MSLQFFSHVQELKFSKSSIEKWHWKQNKDYVKRLKFLYTSLHVTNNTDDMNDTSLKIQSWCSDGGRRPQSAASAMTSMVKGQGH